ncbi:DUF1992 domain-containing protein [bacterium (Candidatus Blackallbacteria) CG17_big_fil_post_rev_8_21_14_2_50_48_46]|uniref:DUF1992 domain-containing protein n=1 Tax=bacterium (Candidatus Blackallbacteria) CG17_big_fil_post_rev_8_21_14_2_50_48_46 TaxID=2014261 RepID=A0A2M7G9Z3_9BACT|nr:MAG: hypothetical protein COW64_13180 [bacterium (Candidatus Blackallbacteria) CG18_big_fil_WC_8_21_14_2_50_49_26]PIW18960.1 MAG: DUF1992 domain-containing protein [bacterium (Candidatus Blackallbacteria) CG17_big_fil_post_rev_8_21_14_2_50_48_46]PIW44672.1 MAG: DUF1992 domain-containing protein [bacterium (Candidatus Blackallbacteria) CG13_big_fil_rev_8_21_14_2_50_49_14]
MGNFDLIVEQKIQEALRRGEFENLPGAGQPLNLEEDSDVPPESRMAYKILKNAGVLPEELQLRKDLKALEALVREIPLSESERRQELLAKINLGWARYHAALEKRKNGP